ncbi:auxin-responsive protein IAA4 isoform X4 [Zea mays]|uniref:auxin-responsive protein IAA4 isoform X4 n=1 Tax=Zea mays TaxID=4577 RepID=UPI0009A96C8E|nr:auxin-responsive protein IAA4 isoform X4 [Zea mays]XP_020398675.1 auxin-responsive protein IAA4 isoform X4 [Zea mays]|eukprot:XP_020398674.1 auxin-responsive protein IAA4 isoform X4 [Zea mays]
MHTCRQHMAGCKQDDDAVGRSPSSSFMDSSSSTHPPALSAASSSGFRPTTTERRDDLSTDLQLGLCSLSPAASSALLVVAESKSVLSTPSRTTQDWPPIKPFLRSALTASARRRRTLLVKVYMEGVAIGRKLDLLLLDGYDSLLAKLRHMFKASITFADAMEYHQRVPHEKPAHVLTYEDRDGDWMMVGDVPWELFLGSVKKLRICKNR